MNLMAVLEGILFVVGDEGITLESVCEILNLNMNEAKELLLKLKSSYEDENRGIRISYLGDAFKLTTKKEHKDYYEKLIESPHSNTLSPSSNKILPYISFLLEPLFIKLSHDGFSLPPLALLMTSWGTE